MSAKYFILLLNNINYNHQEPGLRAQETSHEEEIINNLKFLFLQHWRHLEMVEAKWKIFGDTENIWHNMNTKDKTSRRSGLMLQRTSSKHGHSGFEDLKNYVKDGSDFAKQIVEIIQERAELEATYSKGISKLASKLFKASKENVGTVSNAWHFIANDFEQTSEIHKIVAASMLEEIVKPLKVQNLQ